MADNISTEGDVDLCFASLASCEGHHDIQENRMLLHCYNTAMASLQKVCGASIQLVELVRAFEELLFLKLAKVPLAASPAIA